MNGVGRRGTLSRRSHGIKAEEPRSLNTDGRVVWEKPFEGHEAFILQRGVSLEELMVFDRVGRTATAIDDAEFMNNR